MCRQFLSLLDFQTPILFLLVAASLGNCYGRGVGREGIHISHRSCNFLLDNSAHTTSTTPELIQQYGLPVELHIIVTEDNYVLETHRIPAPGKPPVMILHSLMMSSREMVLNCDRRAMAIRLADEGFDVWLINFRGNDYSRKHTRLRETSRRFWDFSFDEVGFYDASANIDYILRISGHEKITWVGLSLGAVVMFSLLSSRPEYNNKIHLGFALGAATGLSHTRNPLLRISASYSQTIESLVRTFQHGEFMSKSVGPVFHEILPNLCTAEITRGGLGICGLSLILIDGYHANQVEPIVIESILRAYPHSTSIHMVTQWFQWVKTGDFAHYDFGPLKNFFKYRQERAPKYHLKRVTSPVVYLKAENDFLASRNDVEATISMLPNVYKIIQVNSSQWNHIDFAFGKDADIFVYNPMIELLKDTLQNTTEA